MSAGVKARGRGLREPLQLSGLRRKARLRNKWFGGGWGEGEKPRPASAEDICILSGLRGKGRTAIYSFECRETSSLPSPRTVPSMGT
jgi:hypothetical protein